MSKTVRSYRIDPEDDALVQAAARRKDLAPSAFVRKAAVERAVRLLTREHMEGEPVDEDGGEAAA